MRGDIHGSAPAAIAGGDGGPLPGTAHPGEAAPNPRAASPIALSGAYLARTLNGERVIRAVLKSGQVQELAIEEARGWLAQLQPLVDLVDGKHPFSKRRG